VPRREAICIALGMVVSSDAGIGLKGKQSGKDNVQIYTGKKLSLIFDDMNNVKDDANSS